MALRALTKIKPNVLLNSSRWFSYKFEMTPASSRSAPDVEAEAAAAQPDHNDAAKVATDTKPPQGLLAKHKFNVKAAIEEQRLQPGNLPPYFEKNMERNALINPNREPNEGDRINNANQPARRFTVSKTYANASLPLKMVKLANPFPEPVKMMMSRTVSDDEKAEQMLAEARSQKNYADWCRAQGTQPSNPAHQRHFSTIARRFYSKKCKPTATKPECPKLKADGCPPLARKGCKRHPTDLNCKKQEAPYPAYSEFCHEEVDAPPSECKLCPWKDSMHPTYKAPKKHFHTATFPHLLRRTGLEVDNWLGDKAEAEPQAGDAPLDVPAPDELLCDMRKPKCERPKNLRCPPKKEKKKPPPKKKPRKCALSVDDDPPAIFAMNEALVDPIDEDVDAIEMKRKGPPKKARKKSYIRKFPFPCCEYPQRSDQQGHNCPKKKHPPLIEDCPPDKCAEAEMTVRELRLSGGKGGKKKCPVIDMTEDRPDEGDDPCGLKKKPGTKRCPSDLLVKNRRRRPKKPVQKCSDLIPPVEKKDSRPDVTKTV